MVSFSPARNFSRRPERPAAVTPNSRETSSTSSPCKRRGTASTLYLNEKRRGPGAGIPRMSLGALPKCLFSDIRTPRFRSTYSCPCPNRCPSKPSNEGVQKMMTKNRCSSSHQHQPPRLTASPRLLPHPSPEGPPRFSLALHISSPSLPIDIPLLS